MPDILLSAAKFSVERRQVTLRDGRVVDREVVRHPGAVTILPLLADGSIVMIRNWRFAANEALLELPAGTLEADEDPGACAARELEEETGYRAARLEALAEFYTSPGILTERMFAYVATELTPVGQRLDDTEEITVEVGRPADLRRMVAAGQIRDGKTIAVLGMYFLRADTRSAPTGL